MKPAAFHPAVNKDHKTSVFRIQELTEQQIWSLGDKYVASRSGREVRARAELLVEQITNVGLRVEPSTPPPRHGDIIGWPREKNKWMSLAQELAAVAVLQVRG